MLDDQRCPNVSFYRECYVNIPFEEREVKQNDVLEALAWRPSRLSAFLKPLKSASDTPQFQTNTYDRNCYSVLIFFGSNSKMSNS